MSVATRLWELRMRYPVFVACAGVTVAILLIWPVVDFYLREADLVTPFGFNDFGAYSGALRRWSEGGSIYVRDDGGGYHGSYLYPPVTLLLFYPFTGFGFTTGAILFGGISLVLLWVGLDAVAQSLAGELDAATGYPSIPVLSVLLFHLHRYVLEVAINPPEWLPLGAFVSSHAAWFQPGMWATFLLVGLAVYRVAEYGSLSAALGDSDASFRD